MVSVRVLQMKGMASIEQFHTQTTEYYTAGKITQARNNVNAMSRDQKKQYLLHVFELYPDNKTFIDFVLNLI